MSITYGISAADRERLNSEIAEVRRLTEEFLGMPFFDIIRNSLREHMAKGGFAAVSITFYDISLLRGSRYSPSQDNIICRLSFSQMGFRDLDTLQELHAAACGVQRELGDDFAVDCMNCLTFERDADVFYDRNGKPSIGAWVERRA